MQNKIFISIITLIAVGALSDTIYSFVHFSAPDSTTLFVIQEIAQMCYFVSHALLAPTFSFYVMLVNGTGRKRDRRFYILYFLPAAIVEILTLLNPVCHWLYTYDADNTFVRGWVEMLMYGVSAIYMFVGIISLLFFWRALTKKIRLTLLYFFLLVIAGILIQLLFPNIRVELFTEALALLGIMLTVENEASQVDLLTGVYNRHGLKTDLNNYIITQPHFRVYIIRFTNMELVQRLLNAADLDELMVMVANFLKTILPRYYIYRPEPYLFVMVQLRGTKESEDIIARRLKERFEGAWQCGELDITLNAAIICASIPEELKRVEDVLELMNSPIFGKGETVLLQDNEIASVVRKCDVERAVRKAVNKRSFEVYYQPIFDIKKKRIVTAEALVRLFDKEMGAISPAEFIPITEADGLVNDVDMIVLDKVCDFEKRHPLKELGLRHIHINLSAYQLMYSNFMNEFTSILKQHGVSSDGINIEITESADINSSEDIQKGLAELRERNFNLSLDDYGTGYSNLSNVLQMDYRHIKLDKSLLDIAEENERNKTVLLETIRMIRKVNIDVIQEGVETEEQLELVRDAGCDLIQGFYISKPLPEDEFVAFVKNFHWTEYISDLH